MTQELIPNMERHSRAEKPLGAASTACPTGPHVVWGSLIPSRTGLVGLPLPPPSLGPSANLPCSVSRGDLIAKKNQLHSLTGMLSEKRNFLSSKGSFAAPLCP